MFQLDKIDRSSIWFLLVVVTAMVFPWHERVSTIGLLLLVLHWLFDRDLFYKIKSIKIDHAMVLFFTFFLMHVVALLWSDYKSDGIHSIEVKLVFLILPILFSTENYLNTERRIVLEWAFIISCLSAFLYCVVVAYSRNPNSSASFLFERMTISDPLMHPGYLSNYIVFAFVFVCLKLTRNVKKALRLNLILITIGVIFLFALFVFISKTALLFLGFFIVYLLWKLSSYIQNTIVRIVVVFCLLLSIGLVSYTIPSVKYRFNETKMNIPEKKPSEVLFWHSTSARVAAWNLEWDLIKQKPIVGYGTGAANPLLLSSFKQKGYTDLVKYNMHTHNQVFHTWLDLGMLGIVLLFVLLFYVAYLFAVKQKNEIGFWMILLTLVNISTDDMLEIQAGVVFFVFFITLFLYKNKATAKKLRYTY
jgi:O-antigen ligase